MARSSLQLDKLTLISQTVEWTPGHRTLEWFEGYAISKTIEALQFNRMATAKALGISVRTLRTKLVKLRKEGYKVDR